MWFFPYPIFLSFIICIYLASHAKFFFSHFSHLLLTVSEPAVQKNWIVQGGVFGGEKLNIICEGYVGRDGVFGGEKHKHYLCWICTWTYAYVQDSRSICTLLIFEFTTLSRTEVRTQKFLSNNNIRFICFCSSIIFSSKWSSLTLGNILRNYLLPLSSEVCTLVQVNNLFTCYQNTNSRMIALFTALRFSFSS